MARDGLAPGRHPVAQPYRNCTNSGQNCWSERARKILEKLLESSSANSSDGLD